MLQENASSWEAFGIWFLHLKFVPLSYNINNMLISKIYRHPLTVDEWLGILEVSKKYIVEVGTQQALDAITSDATKSILSPCAQLQIVWEFQLEHLYEDAVRVVLNIRPFPQFSENDNVDLGTPLFTALLNIYFEASRARLRLISFIPSLKHNEASCNGRKDQLACENHWANAYGSYTRLLGNTDRYYSSMSVLDKMVHGQFLDVNDICKADMMDYIRAGFQREEQIFEHGRARILDLIRSTRPLAPRRKFNP